MIVKATKKAIVCRAVSETRPASGPSRRLASAGSPIQPRASEARVMPSCAAER